ncbi:MAG: ParA family protein [Promethearchaeota archaeon]
MGKIVAFINRKGGVGKTTISVNLAGYLSSRYNKKILFIDLDPQINASIWLMTENRYVNAIRDNNDGEPGKSGYGKTSYQIFKDAIDGTEIFSNRAIVKGVVRDERGKVDIPNLDLIPSSIKFDDLEREIVSYNDLKLSILIEALEKHNIIKDYDYVMIDCPPNMATASQNAIYACDYFVIPIIPDYLSFQGFPELINTVEKVIKIAKKRRQDNKVPRLGGLIISHFRNTNAQKNTLSEMDNLLKLYKKEGRVDKDASVFIQKITHKTAISEVQANETLLVNSKKKYTSSQSEFEELAREFHEKIR